jgi:hypothetical protein
VGEGERLKEVYAGLVTALHGAVLELRITEERRTGCTAPRIRRGGSSACAAAWRWLGTAGTNSGR